VLGSTAFGGALGVRWTWENHIAQPNHTTTKTV
jgi:hypothetical protein